MPPVQALDWTYQLVSIKGHFIHALVCLNLDSYSPKSLYTWTFSRVGSANLRSGNLVMSAPAAPPKFWATLSSSCWRARSTSGVASTSFPPAACFFCAYSRTWKYNDEILPIGILRFYCAELQKWFNDAVILFQKTTQNVGKSAAACNWLSRTPESLLKQNTSKALAVHVKVKLVN